MASIKSSYQGRTPLPEILARMKDELPKIISKRLDYSMSRRVLAAMIDDVIDAVKTHSIARLNQRLEARWEAPRREAAARAIVKTAKAAFRRRRSNMLA